MTVTGTGAHRVPPRSRDRPAFVDLLAVAARVAPDLPAMEGAAGAVTFADLHRRVAAAATALASRGVDPDAAVRATVTALMPRTGLAPADIATAATSRTAAVVDAAVAAVGTSDWRTVPGLVRGAARRRPDAIAVTDTAGGELTYAALDAAADGLARALVAAGAGPGRFVAVALGRDVDLVVTLLAVMRSGAAYVPLDRAHPSARLRTILDTARPVLAVVGDPDDLAGTTAVPVHTLDELRATDPADDVTLVDPDPREAAYAIFTSGSTGVPKGVVVEHRQVTSLLSALHQTVPADEDDVWSMVHSAAFDVSVAELWTPLTGGGRLVVVDTDTVRNPVDLVDTLDRQGVTLLAATPSLFHPVADVLRARGIPTALRRIVLAGESFDPAAARRWHGDHPGTTTALENLYGPTEATVYVTGRAMTAEFSQAATEPDIGVAFPGSRATVLDARLAPVPDGVPGELHLAGGQLARGYLDRPDLTAVRFVADPAGPPGSRMYRSGDVVRLRDGSLRFAGRADDQIKLRGYRIELGEVESAVYAAPGVSSAVVTVHRPDGESLDGSTDRLVAYVTGAGVEADAVRASVAAVLPDYMVPSDIVVLDRLPLTVNGKVDRAALPAPAPVVVAADAPPATATEETLAAIAAEILGVPDLPVTVSVFDLGGNSLAAARWAVAASERLGVAVSVRDVFAHPSVRALAAAVAGRAGGPDRAPLVPIDRDRTVPFESPLSPAQQRIWFLDTMDPGGPGYVIPFALRLTGALRPDVLAAAVRDLVDRHETLRTRFVAHDGTPVAVVAPSGIDTSGVDEHAADVVVDPPIELRSTPDAVDRVIAETACAGFDLAERPPLRVRLARVADDSWVLVVAIHHIIGDGASVAPMVRDLMAFYRARLTGTPADLPALRVQYTDHAAWQRDLLGDPTDPSSLAAAQLARWRMRLGDVEGVTDLPLDRPRPPVWTDSGAQLTFSIDGDTWTALCRLAHDHGATPFMAMHALLAVTLARSGTDDDIVVGSPVAGRGASGVDDLIGMFVTTVALRTPVDRSAGFVDLLHRVRDVDIEAMADADVPFEMVVADLAPERSTAHPPIFGVALAFQNHDRPDLDLPGVTVDLVDVPTGTTKVDLQITVDAPDGDPDADTPVSGVITYATALFDAETVAEFTDRMRALAAEMVTAPHAPVGDLPLPGAVAPAVGTPDAVSTGRRLADVLDAAVAAHPERVAVVGGGESLTYAEMSARANGLAGRLTAIGVGRGDVVAVVLPRGVDATVAFWGITRTGAAVLPIDPTAPIERIAAMTSLAAVRVAVTDTDVLPNGVTGVPVRGGEGEAPARPHLTPNDVAYVVFTSGSTGMPKGVEVTHAGIAALAAEAVRRLALTEESRVLRLAAPGFDAAVFETVIAAAAGAAQIVVDPGVVGGAELADVLRSEHVTHAVITPAALATVPPDGLDHLAVLCVAGDACGPELVRAWAPGRTMLNLYGPSEATVWSTASTPMTPDRPPTIGTPIEGVGVEVLDARLQPVPVNVAGELYLSGAALARAYRGRPDLTADRFVAGPDGRRRYRTGDLVRRTRSGELVHLGRSDFQLKIRGVRIEPGEVDAVLTARADVARAFTGPHRLGGDIALVSWVVPAGHDVDTAELTTAVAQRLPSAMVPSTIVVVDALPLTPVGKIDRRALPAPVAARAVFVAPADERERAVADVVAAVLDVDRVSVTRLLRPRWDVPVGDTRGRPCRRRLRCRRRCPRPVRPPECSSAGRSTGGTGRRDAHPHRTPSPTGPHPAVPRTAPHVVRQPTRHRLVGVHDPGRRDAARHPRRRRDVPRGARCRRPPRGAPHRVPRVVRRGTGTGRPADVGRRRPPRLGVAARPRLRERSARRAGPRLRRDRGPPAPRPDRVAHADRPSAGARRAPHRRGRAVGADPRRGHRDRLRRARRRHRPGLGAAADPVRRPRARRARDPRRRHRSHVGPGAVAVALAHRAGRRTRPAAAAHRPPAPRRRRRAGRHDHLDAGRRDPGPPPGARDRARGDAVHGRARRSGRRPGPDHRNRRHHRRHTGRRAGPRRDRPAGGDVRQHRRPAHGPAPRRRPRHAPRCGRRRRPGRVRPRPRPLRACRRRARPGAVGVVRTARPGDAGPRRGHHPSGPLLHGRRPDRHPRGSGTRARQGGPDHRRHRHLGWARRCGHRGAQSLRRRDGDDDRPRPDPDARRARRGARVDRARRRGPPRVRGTRRRSRRG
ncbi:hypothetical protein GCM10009722_29480 [Williamsia deligens]